MRLPIYLDNHATTPCDPAVVEAMLPYFTEHFGNAASRGHTFGYRAKSAVERAREQVAALIGATGQEIIWTSGATEADNIALLGTLRKYRERGRHLITVRTEHKAILDVAAAAEREGFDLTLLDVDGEGLISAADVAAALRPDTVLVSVMAVNNEIGVLQPIAEIGTLCRERGVFFHTDAAQAGHTIDLDVRAMNIDLLSLSAHKMYGPKGVGALYVRRGRPHLRPQPLMYGGGHERGLRSGTLPVPLIVGMGKAAELARAGLAEGEMDRITVLRDHLLTRLRRGLDGTHLNGSATARVAGNLNMSFEGVEAEALLMGVRDLALSTGSACTSATLQPSHVLRGLGLSDDLTATSIRIGIGRFNTAEQIDLAAELLVTKVKELRAMGPLYEID